MRVETPGGLPDELEALCWAAGFREQHQTSATDLDPERLTDLLIRHRLATRFLRQLRRGSSPAWCTPALQQAMRAQRAAALACHERQVWALREISAVLPPESRPTAIKGLTTYALTGNRGTIRYSGDMDLLGPDLEGLGSCLEGLGYLPSFDYEWRHEYGSYHRERVALEIHRFYPVYTYPRGVREADLDPQRNPGIWLQSFPSPSRQEIRFADLEPHLTNGTAPEMHDFRVPRPEFAVLILCTHEFKEFIQSPFLLELPVRLALLAEIRDLCSLPEFDWSLFEELVVQFQGNDAVSLIGYLFERLCGHNPFPHHSTAAPRFPRCLGFRGAWGDLGPPEEVLLAPDPMRLLEQVGMSSLRIERTAAPWIRGPIPPGPGGLERCIVHAARGDFDLPALCAWREETEVAIAVRLPRLRHGHQEYRIRFDGASQEECFSVELRQDVEQPEGAGNGRVELASGTPGYELHVRLPWSSLATRDAGAAARIFQTIMRRDQRVLSYYNADAVMTTLLRLSG